MISITPTIVNISAAISDLPINLTVSKNIKNIRSTFDLMLSNSTLSINESQTLTGQNNALFNATFKTLRSDSEITSNATEKIDFSNSVTNGASITFDDEPNRAELEVLILKEVPKTVAQSWLPFLQGAEAFPTQNQPNALTPEEYEAKTSSEPLLSSNSILTSEDLAQFEEISRLSDEEKEIVSIIAMAESLYFSRHHSFLPEGQPEYSNELSLKHLVTHFIRSPDWYTDKQLARFLTNIRAFTPTHIRQKRDVSLPSVQSNNSTLIKLDQLYQGVNQTQFYNGFIGIVMSNDIEHKIVPSSTPTVASKIEQAKRAIKHAFECKVQALANVLFAEVIKLFELGKTVRDVATQSQGDELRAKLEDRLWIIDTILYFIYHSYYSNFFKNKHIELTSLKQEELDFLLLKLNQQATTAEEYLVKNKVPAPLRERHLTAVEVFFQQKLAKILSVPQASTTASPTVNATHTDQDLAKIANIASRLKMAGHMGNEADLQQKAKQMHDNGVRIMDDLFTMHNNITRTVEPGDLVKTCTFENFAKAIVSLANPAIGLGAQFKVMVEEIEQEVSDTSLTADERKQVLEALKIKLEEKFKENSKNPDLREFGEALTIVLSPEPDVQRLRELGIPIKTDGDKALEVSKSLTKTFAPIVFPQIGIVMLVTDIFQGIADNDIDICRYSMDAFLLAASAVDPEEMASMAKDGVAVHPLFGGVKESTAEEFSFVNKHVGEGNTWKFELVDFKSTGELDKMPLTATLKTKYSLVKLEGETSRYAMAFGEKGEEALFKEVDSGGKKTLEFVSGDVKLADKFEISSDGSSVVRKESVAVGELSETQINEKLQELSQERAENEQLLEYSINTVAELSVMQDSMKGAFDASTSHIVNHPTPPKILSYIGELDGKIKQVGERITKWRAVKEHAVKRGRFIDNYQHLLQQELADKIQLQGYETKINGLHLDVTKKLAELNQAKDVLTKAKQAQKPSATELAAVDSKEQAYQKALSELQKTTTEYQELQKKIAEKYRDKLNENARKETQERVDAHKRCRRALGDACGTSSTYQRREPIGEDFWQEIASSLPKAEFDNQFLAYLTSDLSVDTTIESLAEGMVAETPKKLKNYFTAVYRRRIQVRAKMINAKIIRVLKLRDTLRTLTDTNHITQISYEIAELERSATDAFKHAFEYDYAAHKEAMGIDLPRLSQTEVSRLLGDMTKELESLKNPSPDTIPDMTYEASHHQEINNILNGYKDNGVFSGENSQISRAKEPPSRGASGVDIVTEGQRNADFLESLESLTDYVEAMAKTEMVPIDAFKTSKSTKIFPTKYYETNKAYLQNEVVVFENQLKSKSIELMQAEKELETNPTDLARQQKKHAASTCVRNILIQFTTKIKEYVKYSRIVGTEKEFYYMKGQETETQMKNAIPNSMILQRSLERATKYSKQYNSLRDSLGLSNVQVDEYVSRYLRGEGQRTLNEIFTKIGGEDLDLPVIIDDDTAAEFESQIPPENSGDLNIKRPVRLNEQGELLVNQVKKDIGSEATAELPNIEYIRSKESSTSKYYAAISAVRARNKLLTHIEIKINMLERMKAVKEGRQQSTTGSEAYWKENPAIGQNLELFSDLTREIRAIDDIFAQNKQEQPPMGISPELQQEIVTSADHNLMAMDTARSNLLKKYTQLRDTYGFTELEVNNALRELMENGSAVEIIKNTINKHETFRDLFNAQSESDITFPEVSRMGALNQEADFAIHDLYDRTVRDIPTLKYSLEYIDSLNLKAEKSQYFYLNAAVVEAEFLKQLYDFKFNVYDAIDHEQATPAGKTSTSNDFWSRNKELRQKLGSLTRMGINYEKLINFLKQGKDQTALEVINKSHVTANRRKLAVLEKQIAEKEQQLSTKIANTGSTAKQFNVMLNKFLQSPELVNIMLDVFAGDPEYAFKDAFAGRSNAQFSDVVLVDNSLQNSRSVTAGGMQTFRDLFTRLTSDDPPVTTKAIMDTYKRIAPVTKFHYSRTLLAERYFLTARQNLRLEMLERLAREVDLSGITSKDFFVKHQDLLPQLKAVAELGVTYQKRLAELTKGEPPQGLSRQIMNKQTGNRNPTIRATDERLQNARTKFQERANELGARYPEIEAKTNEYLGSPEASAILLNILLEDAEFSEPLQNAAEGGIVNNPQVPVLNPQEPVRNPQVPVRNPQEPVRNPQDGAQNPQASANGGDANAPGGDRTLDELLNGMEAVSDSDIASVIRELERSRVQSSNPTDPQASGSQPSDPQASGSQASGSQASDPQASGSKASGPQASDPQASGSKAGDDSAGSKSVGAQLADELRITRNRKYLKERREVNRKILLREEAALASIHAVEAQAQGELDFILRQMSTEPERAELVELGNQLKSAEVESIKTKTREIELLKDICKLETDENLPNDPQKKHQLEKLKLDYEKAKKITQEARTKELNLLKQHAQEVRKIKAKTGSKVAELLANREHWYEPNEPHENVEDNQSSQKRKTEGDSADVAAKRTRVENNASNEGDFFDLLGNLDFPDQIDSVAMLDDPELLFFGIDYNPEFAFATSLEEFFGISDHQGTHDHSQQQGPRFRRALASKITKNKKIILNF